MRTVASLGMVEARRALDAVTDLCAEREQAAAVAVVDRFGGLIAALRIDGKASRFVDNAIRKAYTAAVFERDTLGLQAWYKAKPTNQLDWGRDPMITTLPGGLVAIAEDEVIGAIGVAGGGAWMKDEEIAEVGLLAMGPGLRHREDGS